MNIDTRGGIGGNGGNCVNGGDGQHGRKGSNATASRRGKDRGQGDN